MYVLEQGKGWHRAAPGRVLGGTLITWPSGGQAFVAQPLLHCPLALWGQAAGLSSAAHLRRMFGTGSLATCWSVVPRTGVCAQLVLDGLGCHKESVGCLLCGNGSGEWAEGSEQDRCRPGL